MKGIILAQGVISADDGNRYHYTSEDFKDERNPSDGDEVDFVLEDSKAKDIYIVKKKFIPTNTNDETGKVRTMAMIGMGLQIAGLIPIIVFLRLIGSILMFVSIFKFNEVAQSKTLFRNYIIGGVISGIGGLVYSIGGITALVGAGLSYMGEKGYSNLTTNGGATAIIGIIVMFIGLYWSFKAYKELSQLSGNKYFLYAFNCYIVAVTTMYFGIGIFVYIAGYALEFTAWFQLKNIKNANEIKEKV